jgi:hypothetical protein
MMPLSKQRVLLAELGGWTELSWDLHDPTRLLGILCHGFLGRERYEVPDFHNDLNAVFKVEEHLINTNPDAQRWVRYNDILNELALRDNLHSSIQGLPFHSPAHHRCEALLRLFNKL